MNSGRPGALPRTSYQIFTPLSATNALPGPPGAARPASATPGTPTVATAANVTTVAAPKRHAATARPVPCANALIGPSSRARSGAQALEHVRLQLAPAVHRAEHTVE